MNRLPSPHSGRGLPAAESEPRFLCDGMLTGLGRWLRAAGYDTQVAGNGRPDSGVVTEARAQRRLLLTCDRALATGADGGVLLLAGNDLAAWARELTATLGVDWLYRPFTRCLNCNTPLQPAREEQHAALPPALRSVKDVRYCSCCDKLYWEGGHLRQMRQRLREWSARYAQVRSGLADTLSAGAVSGDPEPE